MVATLSIVKPITLTEAMLISSDVPETDYAAWASDTTYAIGDRVIRTAGLHKIYESVQAANVNHTPETSPTWWKQVGPTNRWKAFDTSTSSPTVTAGGMTPTIAYTIAPGAAINAVGLVEVRNAISCTLTLQDATFGTVYTKTIDFAQKPPLAGWWEWFFMERGAPTQDVSLDLPAFPTAQLIVALTGGGELSVGAIIFGQAKSVGIGVRYGARVGIVDYSRRETNEYGDITLVQRLWAKRMTFDLMLTASEVDALQYVLADLRTTVCLWIANDGYEALVVYGWYKNFEIVIPYFNLSECSLEVLGMT